MKPYAFLLTIACLSSEVLGQETGRSLFGFPSLFSSQPNPPEITYRELTDLPYNQKGFVITNSQYTQPSRDSPQLSEEQRLFIKAQDDFRKSIAEANQQRVNGESQPAEMIFQQLPKEGAFSQKVFRTENHPQNNFGLKAPAQNFEPFKPSQPFNDPTQFIPHPPPFMHLDPPKSTPSQLFQNQNVQSFSQLPTPSQKVETFIQPQTEHNQFFQRIKPVLTAQPVSPTIIRVPESQPFAQFTPSQHAFTQNQQGDTFKTADEKPHRRRPQRIRQNLESTDGQVVRDPLATTTTEEELFKKQAESAKYSFQSAITDGINDNSQVRQETRDGLKLSGLYSYSDGYFKRTVYYIADENGYRVVKEESEPIGTGPVHNPTGQVDVSTSHSGSTLQYSLKGERLPKRKTSTLSDRRNQ